MYVLYVQRDTALTGITVELLFFGSFSTNTTLFAVVYHRWIWDVIVQIANWAEITGKLDAAPCAILWRILNFAALQTLYTLDIVSVELVVFIWVTLIYVMNLIMAMPARMELLAGFALQQALWLVMRALLLRNLNNSGRDRIHFGGILFWLFSLYYICVGI